MFLHVTADLSYSYSYKTQYIVVSKCKNVK